MRLTALRARNFMAYADFDLPLADIQTASVTGKNMSGKSALLDAFRWATSSEIGRDVSSKDFVIRDGTDAVYVGVEFLAQGNEVKVEREKQRGRTAALTLTVNGQQATRHTIAETETAIAVLIGLTADGLMAGPFMAQEDAASFMNRRAADRKDLVLQLRGLTRFEAYWRAATDQRKVAQGELAAADRLIEAALTRIAHEAETRDALKTANEQVAIWTEAQSLANERINIAREGLSAARERASRTSALTLQRDNLTARITKTTGERDALEARLKTARVLVDRPVTPFDADALAAAEGALDAAQDAARGRVRLEVELRDAVGVVGTRETRLTTMIAARQKMETVPCGAEGIYATCRFLTDVPTEEAIRTAEDERDAAEFDRARIAERLEGVTEPATLPLRDRVDAIRASMEATRREETIRAGAVATVDQGEQTLRALADTLAADGAEMDRIASEITGAEAAVVAVVTWREELEGAESTYAQARSAGDLHASSARAQEIEIAAIDAAKAQLAEWQPKRVDLDTVVTSLGYIAEAFHRDGVPSMLLASAITLIETEANRVLSSLPGDLLVAFRTQRAKAGGGMADTLDVVVTANGWEREYGMLSVGGRFRVDLAIRIGIARMLTYQTGATIQTLWLDEPLAALDDESRTAVMETLGLLAQDFPLIIVVSHSSDFNDAFGACIDVEQIDGVSTARLVA